MYSLYDFQANDVNNIRQAYKDGYRSILYNAPTGAGKTVVFSHISEGVVKKKNRALILVHRYELLRQTSDALQENGILHGLINPKFKANPLASIQVASVQTLVNRLGKIDRNFDLIVIDEAHHSAANSWQKIIGSMPDSMLLGCTATPIRTDGKGLGRRHGGLFDKMVTGPSIADLIEWGYLKTPKVYGSGAILDLSGVKTVRGDYEKAELEARLNKNTITGNAVEHYGRICPGVPAIAFCISIAHAETVAEQFRQGGWNFISIDGKMSDFERSRRLAGLADGTFHGLTSCELISEGTDVPAVGCAIGLRPTKSLSLYIQMSGRALRKYPGQKNAFILDHANNIFRHGYPHENREWSLDDNYIYEPNTGKGGDSRSKLLQCKNCNYILSSGTHTCPECGKTIIHARPLFVKDGQLVEITEEQVKILTGTATKIDPADAKPLSFFQALAKEKKYKLGWAHYMYNAQFKNKTA